MADVFLSYSRENRPDAEVLAEYLRATGRSVFWDRDIPAGATFEQVIDREIDDARCVVVLWSVESVKSDWVRAEAAEGLRRGILLPVLLDDVRLPLQHRQVQGLAAWDKSIKLHAELVQALDRILTGDLGARASAAGWAEAPRRKHAPTHDERPWDPEDVLLGDPDPAIGSLLSYATDLTRTGRKPLPDPALRLAKRAIQSFLAAIVAAFVAGELGDGLAFFLLGGVLGLVSVQPLFRLPRPTTTFVGSEGLARLTQTKAALSVEVVRWTDVEKLFTWELRRFNGQRPLALYTRTLFRRTWHGSGARSLFDIRGAYDDGDGRPPPVQHENPIHFARAAERSYLAYVLPGAISAIERGGEVTFETSKGTGLKLRKDRLVVKLRGGKNLSLAAPSFARAEVADGVLVIHSRREKKTLLGRETDEHRFSAVDIPNLSLLMLLLRDYPNQPKDGAA